MISDINLVIQNDGQPTRRNSKSVIFLIMSAPVFCPYASACDTLIQEKARSDHVALHPSTTMAECPSNSSDKVAILASS